MVIISALIATLGLTTTVAIYYYSKFKKTAVDMLTYQVKFESVVSSLESKILEEVTVKDKKVKAAKPKPRGRKPNVKS